MKLIFIIFLSVTLVVACLAGIADTPLNTGVENTSLKANSQSNSPDSLLAGATDAAKTIEISDSKTSIARKPTEKAIKKSMGSSEPIKVNVKHLSHNSLSKVEREKSLIEPSLPSNRINTTGDESGHLNQSITAVALQNSKLFNKLNSEDVH